MSLLFNILSRFVIAFLPRSKKFLFWAISMALDLMWVIHSKSQFLKSLIWGKITLGRNCKVQFSSVSQSCLTLCDPMHCSMPGLPVQCQFPEFTQTHVHCVSDAIQPSHPLSSPSPPAFSLSQHQCLFQGVSSSHQVAKYWSFSFSISPSNEYSGWISFRMDWLNLFAVQGTLKSLLQHHTSEASIYQL